MASETLANGSNQIIHRLDLDEYGLKEVPEELKNNAKSEVADYLQNEILRNINASTSPVQGEGRFKRLESDYAVREKGGNRLSNLEKDGDLLDSFKVKIAKGSFLEAGHEGNQVPKADGHNQLSTRARKWAANIAFPKRRYIPDGNQKFIPKITNEITKILGEFKATPQERDVQPDIATSFSNADAAGVGIETLFTDDVIDDLLEDALGRGGRL